MCFYYARNLKLSSIYDDGVETWAISAMIIEFEWVLILRTILRMVTFIVRMMMTILVQP